MRSYRKARSGGARVKARQQAPSRPAVAEVAHVAVCRVCGKHQFPTRRDAKAVGRRAYPGQTLSVYECAGYWHFGHLPNAVRHGELPRDAIAPRRLPEVS